jgi:DNA-binding response OmpR family regulator
MESTVNEAGPALRILVIEDNATLRAEVANILELEGFLVETADNGRIGLARIQRSRPDLVLCDIMMPDIDGYETLKQIRAKPATASLPVILISSRDSQQSIRSGMELGATDYVTKPFKVVDLLRVVRAVVERTPRRDARGAS